MVLHQFVTDPWCGLSVIFGGFISHVIGRERINIPEIFSGVHGFTERLQNIIEVVQSYIILTKDSKRVQKVTFLNGTEI